MCIMYHFIFILFFSPQGYKTMCKCIPADCKFSVTLRIFYNKKKMEHKIFTKASFLKISLCYFSPVDQLLC